MNQSNIILEGSISIKACIQGNSRKIYKIIIDKNKISKDFNYIIRLVENKNIKIEFSDNNDIDRQAQGNSHGGIIAFVSDRHEINIAELLSLPSPFFALLDGIEDPYNFGFSIRNLYAAGVSALILPKRNWINASGIVARSSAGASELLKIYSTDDYSDVLKTLKKNNIKIVCAQRDDAISLYDAKLDFPLLIAIGGEKRGLSRNVSEYADQKIYIPYGNNFKNSLGSSGACAVLSFEIFRQNNNRH